jgi:hypothetical protein
LTGVIVNAVPLQTELFIVVIAGWGNRDVVVCAETVEQLLPFVTLTV